VSPWTRWLRGPRRQAAAAGLVALGAWCTSSCAPTGFQDEAQLQGGVRIRASSADAPYAQPGQPGRVDVLAYDGRSAADRSASPMHVYWFPVVCENPSLDAYYSCFAQFAHPDGGTFGQVVDDDASTESEDGGVEAAVAEGGGSGDAGSADSGAADAGTRDSGGQDVGTEVDADADDADADEDSSPGAPVVSSFRFVVPANVVSSHPVVPGTTPYGLLIAFNFACAGQLQLLPLSGNPQAPPLGCVGANGQLVGSDSYVFGYTRVYAYAADAGVSGVNTNPVVDCIDVEGASASGSAAGDAGSPCAGMFPLAGEAPFLTSLPVTIPGCSAGQTQCPHIKIGPHVTPASWEPVANGLHEEIWADYYSTFGTFTHDATLLYDPMAGLIGAPKVTDTEFDPPVGPADGYVWIVVHDNRGGAAWVTVPVHVGP
jgi:hypothetical protein